MSHLPKPFFFLLHIFLLAACASAPVVVAPTPPATVAPRPNATSMPGATASPSAAPTPSASPTPTEAPSPAPTFAPIAPTPTLAPLGAAEREKLFTQVWTLVRDRYVYRDYRGLDWNAIRAEYEPQIAAASSEEKVYDLLRAMIGRLGDEHSVFLSPQDVAEVDAEFEGTLQFGGIGVRVREVDEGALIIALAHGGPAEEAGIQPREVITAIEGRSLKGMSEEGGNPLALARGEPGTSVQLTVRSTSGNEREVAVTRRVISGSAFPSVSGEWLPRTNVGLLRIDTFYEQDLDKQVRTALEGLLVNGPLDGLIIDVRDNGGGRLDYLLNTLALFVNGGEIGSEAGRNQSEPIVVPPGETLPALHGTPIVVLTGPDTVSAAELFAAGMQVLGRAKVVGEPSAGNTEVLLTHDLFDGSELRLAESAYRLPNGQLNEGRGVQPDRVVKAEWWRFAPQDDPVVQAAEEVLAES